MIAQTTSGSVVLSFTPDGSLAVIQLGSDDERAVTITAQRLQSFVAALEEVKRSAASGLVIRAPSLDTFCVGADINVIQSVTDPKLGAALAAEGQRAFDLLEDLGCVTVAAISGPCVGGGCELALACQFRIISDHKSSAIGLPETKIGILPGFGGTYRLPRLVGLPKSLDIILAGKTLRSAQALKAGLVDEVVPTSQLLERAYAIARRERPPRRRALSRLDWALTWTAPGRYLVRSQAGKKLQQQTKGCYPAPSVALETTVAGLSKKRSQALSAEAEAVGQMVITPESKALVHIYFLTEAAKSIGKGAKVTKDSHGNPHQLNALVVGAGTMGAGIAGAVARCGGSVIVRDTTEAAIARGREHVSKELSKSRGMPSFERAAIGNRIDWITRTSPTEARTGIVIEAVFESMDLKKKIFNELAPRVREDCILASNTSSLSITEMASAVAQPARVVGMHFFNPVEKMPLVEIIRGAATSDETVATVAALTIRMGKFPIVVNDVPGFLVNRILIPYLNEAMFLLQEGHSIEAIDDAATAFGMPMGPFRLLDEVGLDVAAHVSKIMIDGYGSRMAPPNFAERMSATGRKGKKSDGGFFTYSDKKAAVWPELHATLGIPRAPATPLSRTEIGERLVFHLVNEAMKCLDEGVAGDDRDFARKQIDLGTVMGIGFPPFRGGVLYYAEKTGLETILGRLRTFHATYGERYTPFRQ